jgi:hypothetical protein
METGSTLNKAYLGFKRITLPGMGAVKMPKVGWVKLRGYRPKASRRSQSEFVCTSCGHADNADTVAAQNVVRAGLVRRACESNHRSGRKQEDHALQGVSEEFSHV